MPSRQTKNSKDRVDNLLQEIRIVLPGTQALLGFQFVAFFNTAFKSLSTGLQIYHLVNLLLVTCSIILLITPVAYEEIGENGRTTSQFLRFTSRTITAAMLFLLAGMTGDIFIAGSLIETNKIIAAITAGLLFIFGAIMWFGLTLALRKD